MDKLRNIPLFLFFFLFLLFGLFLLCGFLLFLFFLLFRLLLHGKQLYFDKKYPQKDFRIVLYASCYMNGEKKYQSNDKKDRADDYERRHRLSPVDVFIGGSSSIDESPNIRRNFSVVP